MSGGVGSGILDIFRCCGHFDFDKSSTGVNLSFSGSEEKNGCSRVPIEQLPKGWLEDTFLNSFCFLKKPNWLKHYIKKAQFLETPVDGEYHAFLFIREMTVCGGQCGNWERN